MLVIISERHKREIGSKVSPAAWEEPSLESRVEELEKSLKPTHIVCRGFDKDEVMRVLSERPELPTLTYEEWEKQRFLDSNTTWGIALVF